MKQKVKGAGVALRDGEVEEHYEVRFKSPYGDNILRGRDLAMMDDFWKHNHETMQKNEIFIVQVKTRVIKCWDPDTKAWRNPREKDNEG